MVVVQIGQRHRQLAGVHARQAGATEHYIDVVVGHIGGDATPQQLHDGAAPVLQVDTGSADFQYFALEGQEFGDVVFVRCVELTAPEGGFAPHQAIGADHRTPILAAVVVEHQEVVAIGVEGIELAPGRGHFPCRLRSHLLAEYSEPQLLGGAHLLARFGQANVKIAGPDIDRLTARCLA